MDKSNYLIFYLKSALVTSPTFQSSHKIVDENLFSNRQPCFTKELVINCQIEWKIELFSFTRWQQKENTFQCFQFVCKIHSAMTCICPHKPVECGVLERDRKKCIYNRKTPINAIKDRKKKKKMKSLSMKIRIYEHRIVMIYDIDNNYTGI